MQRTNRGTKSEILEESERTMSIPKKSLISTLKAAKKAKVASAPLAQVETELVTDKKLARKLVKPTFSKKTRAVFSKRG